MHPILFQIGPWTIYSYGVMIALAFLVVTYLGSKNAPHLPITELVIVILASGLMGARLFYVLANLEEYIHNPKEILMIHHGGLIFYGGMLSGTLGAVWFLAKRKLSVWEAGDYIIPYAALGQSIGRIGCFFNGCCYGKPTHFALGVYFPGVSRPLHPTQLYASLNMLLLFLILRFLAERKQYPGQVFLAYFFLYSLTRFFIEFLRGDNLPLAWGLTLSQIISAIIFFAAASLLIIFAKKKKR